jgi:ACS family hexuronate transporter-like MFS transporter
MPNPPPARRLWFIVALLFMASFLNYLDRQTLSVLKPTIKGEFALDEAGYAFLVNVFTFCYAAAYIGSGWVVDRLGARLALTLFMVGWSIATICGGLARSFFLFAAFRALLGIMEPGNFPASIRAMTLWAPLKNRAFLMSLAGAGGTVGAIAAAPLIAWLATVSSWRMAFVVPGVAGLLLAAAWWLVFREPQAVAAAAPLAPALPWGQLWRQRSTWGVVLARLVSDPVWYFCLFWMPGYFQEQRGMTLQGAGMVGWIPFLVGNVGALSLAALSDRLVRRGGETLGARRKVLLGAACVAPLVALVPHAPGLPLTVALLSLTATICLTWLLLLMPVIADTFPAGNVASVWAIAGAFGATGAMICNYAFGQISTPEGSARMFLVLGCLHPIAAVLLFTCVAKVKPAAPAVAV